MIEAIYFYDTGKGIYLKKYLWFLANAAELLYLMKDIKELNLI